MKALRWADLATLGIRSPLEQVDYWLSAEAIDSDAVVRLRRAPPDVLRRWRLPVITVWRSMLVCSLYGFNPAQGEYALADSLALRAFIRCAPLERTPSAFQLLKHARRHEHDLVESLDLTARAWVGAGPHPVGPGQRLAFIDDWARHTSTRPDLAIACLTRPSRAAR